MAKGQAPLIEGKISNRNSSVGFDNLGDFLKIGPKTGLKIRALLEFIQKSIEAEFPDNCWILFYVAVSNEFHNKGIGRHLLSHVLTGM